MFINDFLKDINLTRIDIFYLTILVLFSLFVTINTININMVLNIKADVIVYLTNALFYSGLGENIHNTSNLFLSPVICYLTGLLMNFGISGKESIFIVTGFFCIMANVSIYILLKYRFNRLLALFGAFLFGSFKLILIYWADGTLDVSVISLSIWTIIFIILAIYENPKYYLVCFPLLVLSIFTRYSAFFMIPLILLYFLSKNDFFNNVDLLLYDRKEFKKKADSYLKSKEFRYIMLGIVIAIVLFIGICHTITSNGAGLTFLTQISDSIRGFEGPKYNISVSYRPDSYFYCSKFLNLLDFDSIQIFGFNFSKLILILIVISISIYLINFTINFDVVKKLNSEKTSFKVRHFDKFLWILLVILIMLFIYGLSFSHMLSNISMLVAMVVMFSILDKYPISKKFYSMNFLCMAWFLVYFIFYSMINIKTYRYLISCIPPLVYFAVWALDSIFRTIQDGFEDNDSFLKKHQKNLTFKFSDKSRRGTYLEIILILMIFILMIQAFTFERDYVFDRYDNSKLDKIFDFMMENDTDYLSKSIVTDEGYYSLYGTWYLQKDVNLNRSLFNGTPSEDYIIKNHYVENLTDYKVLFRTDKVHLFEHK